MVSRYSFNCKTCGKEFAIKGYWFNQIVLHQYLDYKWLLHCIFCHWKKPSRKEIKYFSKMTLIWIPLIILQIIDIPISLIKWYL